MLMTTADSVIYPDWPMFGLRENAMQFALAYLNAGVEVALATLIHTEGGAPRTTGTQMAFTEDDMIGFFSGGCIEADVALHARATLLDGEPRKLIYGEGSAFGDIQLQCGASITIAVERVLPSDPVIAASINLLADRKEAVWISDGTRRSAASRPSDFAPPWHNLAEHAFMSSSDGGQIDASHYWVRHRPAVRLIIAGSDPTALAIAQLAKEAEFEVIFVRPLGPTLPPPVNPHAYRPTRAERVFEEFGLDNRTAVVFANHDFDASRDEIAQALRSRAGYVGMIGSRRQRPSKDEWLREIGFAEDDIARFRSPIGLSIGKSSPAAIAISVIAEVIRVMNVP